MSKLKSALKKRTPFLYQLGSKVKQIFITPVVTGHLQYYIQYLFTLKHKEVQNLRKHGFTRIKPIKYQEWRIGRGKDHAFRRYYTAVYQHNKCFIKVGQNDATVRNECMLGSGGYLDNITFSPVFLTGDLTFDTDVVMLAVQFLDGLRPFSIPDTEEQFRQMCDQFNTILDVLNDEGIVHADIHKGNLMTQADRLILMDYGISMKKEIGNKVDYLARPGTFYRTDANGREYDDAYSFVQLVHGLNLPDEYLKIESFKAIESKIGRNSIIVTLQSVICNL